MSQQTVQQIAMTFYETRTEKSYQELFLRLRPGLVNYIKYYIKNADDVEDVVNETFMKVYTHIDQYNPKWNFSTWAYRIGRNEAYKMIRYQNPLVSMDTFVDSEVRQKPSFDDYWIEKPMFEFLDKKKLTLEEDYQIAIQKIHDLPKLFKDIMIDREVKGMKYQEIADHYKMNISTVKTRIRTARNKIKKDIGPIDFNYL